MEKAPEWVAVWEGPEGGWVVLPAEVEWADPAAEARAWEVDPADAADRNQAAPAKAAPRRIWA